MILGGVVALIAIIEPYAIARGTLALRKDKMEVIIMTVTRPRLLRRPRIAVMKRMIELACQSKHGVVVLEWSAIKKISAER